MQSTAAKAALQFCNRSQYVHAVTPALPTQQQCAPRALHATGCCVQLPNLLCEPSRKEPAEVGHGSWPSAAADPYKAAPARMLQELKRLLSLYYNKLYNYILTAPPGSLQLTGVLGLAALVIAYYQLRRDDAPSSSSSTEQQRQRAQQAAGRYGTGVGAAAAAAGGRLAAGSSAAAAVAAKAGADAAGGSSSSGRQQELFGDPMSLERRVRSKLAGIRRVTISSLGPLTEEWSSTDLQEGANLRSEAAELLRELCACADTYIITQVRCHCQWW